MKQFWPSLFLLVFSAVVLALSLRGKLGNFAVSDLLTPSWAEGGPFELSVERGRFALTFSLVEDKTPFFSLPVARFATPDLGYKDGRYVSLFAPGLSFLLIPGYVLGKLWGAAQVGTYAVVSLFALVNVLLVFLISCRLGASSAAAIVAALIFLFATPAFPYAVSLYQHHLSALLILASVWVLISTSGLLPLTLIWLLIASAATVDYPNLFLLLPVAVAALGRFIAVDSAEVSIRPRGIVTFATALLPLVLFFWFNAVSYGSPFQLAGTVVQVKAIDAAGRPTTPATADPREILSFIDPDLRPQDDRSPLKFFKPRNLINGLYLQFLSPDRGMVYFTPVIFGGVIGAYLLYRRRHWVVPVLVAIIGVDVLLYAMWGDPWGGWAFGSRYLIPAYAILAGLAGVALSSFRRSWLVIPFALVAIYSLAVNTAGALTSNANPPQVEVLPLEKLSGQEQKYTWARNWDHLRAGRVKSVVFREFARRWLNGIEYFYLVFGLVAIALVGSLVVLYVDR